MTITILPIDADPTTSLPSYSALTERQAFAAMDSNPLGSVFGGRSGFRVGTLPNIVSVTSTQWTLNPCSARIFPAGVTYQGGYGWATDQAITGTAPANFTVADPSNPRLDILYITVNDTSAGDGSGARSAPVNYLAGTPSATPAAPTLPPRSFLVATISVPKAGTGSPTITLNTARYVAAGAPDRVFSQGERDGLTAYDGLAVRRMDLAGRPIQTSNGTTWLSERAEHLQVSTADGTWAYNVSLTRHTNDDGTKTVSVGFIVARVGGGAFTVNAGAWTSILTGLIPTGWRPTDSITVAGTYEFNGLGSALFKFDTGGGVSAAGVTGSFSCGSPTKLSTSVNWLCA